MDQKCLTKCQELFSSYIVLHYNSHSMSYTFVKKNILQYIVLHSNDPGPVKRNVLQCIVLHLHVAGDPGIFGMVLRCKTIRCLTLQFNQKEEGDFSSPSSMRLSVDVAFDVWFDEVKFLKDCADMVNPIQAVDI